MKHLIPALSLSLFALSAAPGWAQHTHPSPPAASPTPTASPVPEPSASPSVHEGHEHQHETPALPSSETDTAPSPSPLSDAEIMKQALGDHHHGMNPLMERARTLGSGTSLLPQTSPMRMWSIAQGSWL